MTVTLKNIARAFNSPKQALIILCQKFLDRMNGFSYDFFKNGESDLLVKLSHINPKTVFDVGANIGDWSLVAHKNFPEATIHCFELSEKTFKKLEENVGRYAFVLNNIGLSEKAGVFEYKDYGESSGGNTILLDQTFHDKHRKPDLLKATLSTGDEYCKAMNVSSIDFLKIDVEGAEHLVIKGFAGLLGEGAIRAIQFEYGYANGDAKYLMRDFHNLFSSYGYIVARIQKGPIVFREWTYKDNDFHSGPNYVAVRKGDSELIELLSRDL